MGMGQSQKKNKKRPVIMGMHHPQKPSHEAKDTTMSMNKRDQQHQRRPTTKRPVIMGMNHPQKPSHAEKGTIEW